MKRFPEIIRTDEKVSPLYIVANKFKFFVFKALREWLNIYLHIYENINKKINNGFKIHWILKKKFLRNVCGHFYDDAEVFSY